MSKHHIKYGNTTIDFDLEYSNRKSLGITVHPDTTVLVKAPENTDYSKIKSKVQKRGRWILKQRNHFESFLPNTPERKYVSGETHLYLGKQYRLKLFEDDSEQVKMIRGYIQVYTKDKTNKERIKGLLTQWYRNHFEKKINEHLEENIEHFQQYNLKKPEIQVRKMKNRWGSCTPKGKLIINPEIIKAPSRCIDYVIIHELCHLIHPTHSKDFYALQTKMMPDWKKWKFRLDEMLS
ncbi:MAG: M48 family metallopeptidase [Bacteroidales bacterium]